MRSAATLVVLALSGVAAAAAAPSDPCAVVFVVDRSRAMAPKLEAIATAIAATSAALAPADRVAVVAFDSRATVVAPLQPANARVARVTAGDAGANTLAGLQEARALLAKHGGGCKRVFVITNGTALLGIAPLATEMRAADIRISAVGIQSLNRPTLESIARSGDGRAYVLEDPAQLAALVAAEVKTPLDARQTTAVVLVLERSWRMAGARLEMAKELMRATVEVLHPHDLVAVVTFDRDASITTPLQRAVNRTAVSSDITRLQAGRGADPLAALRATRDLLTAAKVDRKHVIFIGMDGADGVGELVGELAASRIAVSTIAVPGADRRVLAALAERTLGRHYAIEDVTALPRLFLSQP